MSSNIEQVMNALEVCTHLSDASLAAIREAVESGGVLIRFPVGAKYYESRSIRVIQDALRDEGLGVAAYYWQATGEDDGDAED